MLCGVCQNPSEHHQTFPTSKEKIIVANFLFFFVNLYADKSTIRKKTVFRAVRILSFDCCCQNRLRLLILCTAKQGVGTVATRDWISLIERQNCSVNIFSEQRNPKNNNKPQIYYGIANPSQSQQNVCPKLQDDLALWIVAKHFGVAVIGLVKSLFLTKNLCFETLQKAFDLKRRKPKPKITGISHMSLDAFTAGTRIKQSIEFFKSCSGKTHTSLYSSDVMISVH